MKPNLDKTTNQWKKHDKIKLQKLLTKNQLNELVCYRQQTDD